MSRNDLTVRPLRGTGVLLGAAAVTTGLSAGTFYTFACAVMPGLARGTDRTYIESMQHMNAAIENPVFFLSFLGAPLLTAAAAWRLRGSGGPATRWVLAALGAYSVAFVLTVAVNIPLNERLADAGDPARIGDPAAVRADFEDPWVAWNAVRALLTTLAFGFLVRALVLFGGRREAGRADVAGNTEGAGRADAARNTEEAGRADAARNTKGAGNAEGAGAQSAYLDPAPGTGSSASR
ncbi:DUF1772 domain-containing protein [Streptomyces sp. p1417]|uniref:DUF1772 domain-containing protein n=1 Tax=Streptomyces typhae TaxID=2681492 RepID=A0A6L6WUF9_9ACTN|nr:anthrone oxygenase family protein [Streptomyces typhae]MVO84804.1 DUF1772 domain-containing protein [Streptomyces typhae]